MAVNEIKKHLLRLTQSNILPLALFLPSSFGFGQNEGCSEYILLLSSVQVFSLFLYKCT